MRHLLTLVITTLCAYPALAGNLGVADQIMIGVDAKNPSYNKLSFKVHPGPYSGRGTDTSIASFSDGRFTIRTDERTIDRLRSTGRIDSDYKLNEDGILPSQVISFDYHMQSPLVVFTLFYRDNLGKPRLATWNFLWAENEVKAFKTVFLKWMAGELDSLQQ